MTAAPLNLDLPIPPALGNGPGILDKGYAILAQIQAEVNRQRAENDRAEALADEMRAERVVLQGLVARLEHALSDGSASGRVDVVTSLEPVCARPEPPVCDLERMPVLAAKLARQKQRPYAPEPPCDTEPT